MREGGTSERAFYLFLFYSPAIDFTLALHFCISAFLPHLCISAASLHPCISALLHLSLSLSAQGRWAPGTAGDFHSIHFDSIAEPELNAAERRSPSIGCPISVSLSMTLISASGSNLLFPATATARSLVRSLTSSRTLHDDHTTITQRSHEDYTKITRRSHKNHTRITQESHDDHTGIYIRRTKKRHRAEPELAGIIIASSRQPSLARIIVIRLRFRRHLSLPPLASISALRF